MNATAAQVADLITAAGKAAGMLEALEMLVPQHATKIEKARKELASATWAALGRPAPSSAAGIRK